MPRTHIRLILFAATVGFAVASPKPAAQLDAPLKPYLHASFAQKALSPRLRWHCEPARWSLHPEGPFLRIEPAAGTDFWQRTHYGFRPDNGHYLYCPISGDFVLTVHVRFQPLHQYDQAGLMVRLSSNSWLKASVEHEPDGQGRLGAVVTNFGYSDWSTQPFSSRMVDIWLRARREADDYIVDASRDGRHWEQLRMAHLHEARGKSVTCGLYTCSPKESGFKADFSSLTIDRGRVSVTH